MPLTISGRAVSSRRPLFEDWSIPVTPDDFGGGEGLTLRALIALVVRAEVAAYAARREARRLDRVLSREAIERGAAQGSVRPEARPMAAPPGEDEAIANAWQAFEDGLYIVAVDGREVKDLDAQVFVRPDSRVVFIRLVFLAGA